MLPLQPPNLLLLQPLILLPLQPLSLLPLQPLSLLLLQVRPVLCPTSSWVTCLAHACGSGGMLAGTLTGQLLYLGA